LQVEANKKKLQQKRMTNGSHYSSEAMTEKEEQAELLDEGNVTEPTTN